MTGTVHRLWQILGVVEKEALYLRSVISRLFPQAGALAADQLQNLLRVAGELLLGQILKHGVRLLRNDSDYAEQLKRHLFEEADFIPYRRRILAERRQAWIGK